MAVYKRSYRGYAGPLTPDWSRFAVIPRYAYRDLFHSKIMTAFFVLCFVAPLVFLFLLYFSHNFTRLAAMLGERSATSPIAINEHFFLVLLEHSRRTGFHPDGLRRPRPDLARSRQRRPAAVLLPAVLARGVRAGKDVGTAHPALAHHLGSGTGAVRRAGQPGGRGVAGRESVDRLGFIRRRVDLDSDRRAAGAGPFGMDQVADRGRRSAAGGLLRRRRIRRDD